MEAIDLIKIYQSQVSLLNQLWTYYGTVTLAIIGFTIGSDKATRSWFEVTVIEIGYGLFAAGNLSALHNTQMELEKLSLTVNAVLKATKGFNGEVFSPFSGELIAIFHIAVTLAVMVAILVTYKMRKKTKPE